MREYTIVLPASPRALYMWLDKWVGTINARWGVGRMVVANAIFYQLTRPNYLDVIKQPLPHTMSIFRYKTGSNLTPRVTNKLWGSLARSQPPSDRDPIADALAEPKALAIELIVSANDDGIEVAIHYNDLLLNQVRLEDFVMDIENAAWSVDHAAYEKRADELERRLDEATEGVSQELKGINQDLDEAIARLKAQEAEIEQDSRPKWERITDIGYDRKLVELWNQGKTVAEIAKKLDKGQKTIEGRISTLRAEYKEKIPDLLPYRKA